MISREEWVETVQDDAVPKAANKVVVAEADLGVQSLMSDQVAALGHVVVATSRNWPAAMDLARALQPDLLIISLELPGADLEQLGSLIAAQPALTVIGIAYPDYQDEDAALQAGLHQFLKQGYKLHDLEGAIAKALANRKGRG
jgi:CheY-like chemotaxis protein